MTRGQNLNFEMLLYVLAWLLVLLLIMLLRIVYLILRCKDVNYFEKNK